MPIDFFPYFGCFEKWEIWAACLHHDFWINEHGLTQGGVVGCIAIVAVGSIPVVTLEKLKHRPREGNPTVT